MTFHFCNLKNKLKRKEVKCTHQAFRHGRLVAGGEMLLQGQDDAVGDDRGQDHVFKRSARVKEVEFISLSQLNHNCCVDDFKDRGRQR